MVTAMQEYCEQDVVVLHRLYEALAAEGGWQSLDFEHRIAEICYEICNNGWNLTSDQLANSMRSWPSKGPLWKMN